MERKVDQLRRMIDAEDWHGALRMAARFPRLGAHREAIQVAWSALTNPDIYRQMRKDPKALVAEGITALRERYRHATAS